MREEERQAKAKVLGIGFDKRSVEGGTRKQRKNRKRENPATATAAAAVTVVVVVKS